MPNYENRKTTSENDLPRSRGAGEHSEDVRDAEDDRHADKELESPRAVAWVLGHVTQQNGELTEDTVEAAVVESTAVAEDGGVRSVEVDDHDRIVWVAPLPEDISADVAALSGEPVEGDRRNTGVRADDT